MAYLGLAQQGSDRATSGRVGPTTPVFFTDAVMRGLLANSLETAALGPDGFTDVGTGLGSAEGTYIDWLTISDAQQAVVDDVTRIRKHPLVPGRIPIHGFLHDVRTGRLLEVPGASEAGQR